MGGTVYNYLLSYHKNQLDLGKYTIRGSYQHPPRGVFFGTLRLAQGLLDGTLGLIHLTPRPEGPGMGCWFAYHQGCPVGVVKHILLSQKMVSFPFCSAILTTSQTIPT